MNQEVEILVKNIEAKFKGSQLKMLRVKAIRRFSEILDSLNVDDSNLNEMKELLLHYLLEVNKLNPETLTFKKIDRLNKESLFKISNHLHKEYSYVTVGNWLPRYSGVIVDLILLVLGVLQQLYYIPLGLIISYVIFSLHEKSVVMKNKHMY